MTRPGAARVVVSGTHASGKSTLIGDFAMANREWIVLPDPFELVDAQEEPDAVFVRQLRIAAGRLLEPAHGPVLAERGPLDFLAYLDALSRLGRSTRSQDLLRRGIPLTAQAMAGVDLLVLLPLAAHFGRLSWVRNRFGFVLPGRSSWPMGWLAMFYLLWDHLGSIPGFPQLATRISEVNETFLYGFILIYAITLRSRVRRTLA